MNHLLDTHTFLWFIADAPDLSRHAKNLIEEPDATVYLSAASLWEIAIKVSLGKLTVPSPFAAFVQRQLIDNRIALLAIQPEHVEVVVSLPFHHRDPFDRLIIAQAQHENLSIIGRDMIFDAYTVVRYW